MKKLAHYSFPLSVELILFNSVMKKFRHLKAYFFFLHCQHTLPLFACENLHFKTSFKVFRQIFLKYFYIVKYSKLNIFHYIPLNIDNNNVDI